MIDLAPPLASASPAPRPRLGGCGTALLTPFTPEGPVDDRALRALVDWQVEEGIRFLVPCGSTGEATTLSRRERQRVVATVVDAAAGRVPVVAGATSGDTREAVRLSRLLRAAGATHLLHAAPPYVRPPQRGLVAHFRAIAEQVDAGLLLYNVPSRTACNLEAETTLELATVPNVVGIKEASGNLGQIREILRHRPPGFVVLAGDDALTCDVVARGGDGVVSVLANAAPAAMARLVACALAGASDDARRLQDGLAPLLRALSLEPNPIPAKALLAAMGRMRNLLRLPLVPLDECHLPELLSCAIAGGVLR